MLIPPFHFPSLNNYNFINGLICWVVFTEDIKNGVIRTSARSRGVKINKLFEQYNGGGHAKASGARLKTFEEVDDLIKDLDTEAKKYKDILYIRVLGFNKKGQNYLKQIKKDINIPIITKVSDSNNEMLLLEQKVTNIFSLILKNITIFCKKHLFFYF